MGNEIGQNTERAQLRTVLRELQAGLQKLYGKNTPLILLYGSYARGQAHRDSDIDILVVVQPDDDRARLERVAVDTAFDVNLQHDVYISPRVLTPGILADPVWGQTPFLKAVQRESVAL